MWDYDDALAWLYGRQALGIKLGLDKVRRLLAAIGDPQDAYGSVHVAGTNGKGTVTLLVAAILRRAGHRVGAYTSPHLVRFTERILVDGVQITPDEVARGLWRLREPVAALDAAGTPPTFFEVTTALALAHFRDAGCTLAVIETGMGGRLDATNVLTPMVTVITNVAMDHMAFLGPTLADITYEKAGIIKPGVPLVTGATGEPLVALKAVSRAQRVPMSVVGEDYDVRSEPGRLRLRTPAGEASYRLAIAGSHQARNAAIAVAVIDALREAGTDIPPAAVQQALADEAVPGRLETVVAPAGGLAPGAHGDVEVLLDGAHNEDAAHALRRHLGAEDWTGFHLIVGAAADKDWQALLDQWVPLAAQVWGVPIRNRRSLDPEAMRPVVMDYGIPFDTRPDAGAALGAAAAAGARRIVVAGSFFLVGEARARLLGMPLEEVRGDQ